MKTMVERNQVLERYRIKGQSKRQIAEEMVISRHTVDKIVWEYEGSVWMPTESATWMLCIASWGRSPGSIRPNAVVRW